MSLSQAYATTTAGSSSGLGTAFRSMRAAVGRVFAEHQVRTRARAELETYSDRQLMDLGISRADIPSIVRGTYSR